jgi:hypothetical protein
MVPMDQLEGLKASYPDADLENLSDGTFLVVVPVHLPPGWSASATTVRFVVPGAYPASPPDCFFGDQSLRLANGTLPANSAHQVFHGAQFLWFSWHVSNWHPNRNDIASFVRFIERRFRNAN